MVTSETDSIMEKDCLMCIRKSITMDLSMKGSIMAKVSLLMKVGIPTEETSSMGSRMEMVPCQSRMVKHFQESFMITHSIKESPLKMVYSMVKEL